MGVLGNLSSDQLLLFQSQGYLVVELFASPEEMESMKNRMNEMVQQLDSLAISQIFSQQSTNDYLFESVEKASFFFEEKVFDKEGNLQQPKEVSISKVAHGLHEIDPTFRKYSRSEKVETLLSSLGYKKPVIIQSVYVFKQAGIGGEVAAHQDSSFLYTEPSSSTGLWLALEDATISNGCLRAIPGSHKNGLARRFFRDQNGVHFDKPSPVYDENDFVPIEVKAGSLVLINGLLVHQSYANKSSNSRQAYTIHAVDTEDGCIWPQENWIKRKVDPEPLYSI